jgi:hypothetical protein
LPRKAQTLTYANYASGLSFSRALKAEFFEQDPRIDFCNGQMRAGTEKYCSVNPLEFLFIP